MQKQSEIKYLVMIFLATGLSLAALLHFDVIERVAYSVRRGQLRAVKETLPSPGELRKRTETTRAVAQIVSPAVVSITTETARPTSRRESREDREDRDSSRQRSLVQGLGSGFIFDAENGYIMTNTHVVRDVDKVMVQLSDGRTAEADVLETDPNTDLAIIRIKLNRLHELGFGDSIEVGVGDDVLAVGNPFGLGGTFSKGIISAVNRGGVRVDGHYLEGIRKRGEGFLQTDAVINPGQSGGPLVNMLGEVVGINTAIATNTGHYEGVGFAVPSNEAKRLITRLKESGFMGIWVGEVADDFKEEAEALDWDKPYGAIITEVMKGLAADRAGLKPDDIIVSVNGERLTDLDGDSRPFTSRSPGTLVSLEIWREGKMRKIPLRLGRAYAPR